MADQILIQRTQERAREVLQLLRQGVPQAVINRANETLQQAEFQGFSEMGSMKAVIRKCGGPNMTPAQQTLMWLLLIDAAVIVHKRGTKMRDMLLASSPELVIKLNALQTTFALVAPARHTRLAPEALTLSRLAILAGTWLMRTVNAAGAGSGFCETPATSDLPWQFPAIMLCQTFPSMVPKGQGFDTVARAAMYYNRRLSDVIGRKNRDWLHLDDRDKRERVEQIARAQREGGSASDASRIAFLLAMGILTGTAAAPVIAPTIAALAAEHVDEPGLVPAIPACQVSYVPIRLINGAEVVNAAREEGGIDDLNPWQDYADLLPPGVANAAGGAVGGLLAMDQE